MRRALRFLLGEQLAIWQSSTLLEKANIFLNLIVCFDGPATMIGLDKVTTTVGLPKGESALPSSDDGAIILKRGLSSMLII